MQTLKKARPTHLENRLVIEVPEQIIGGPQTEAQISAPAIKTSQPHSFFHNVILPESGVPFSPLND